MQELEYPRRQAHRLERLGVALGDERSLRRHLEDDAVAGEERGHHGVHRGEPGVVPRRDDEHHPERLAADEALEAVFLPYVEIPERLLGDVAHVERTLVEAALELAGRLAHRASHLPG